MYSNTMYTLNSTQIEWFDAVLNRRKKEICLPCLIPIALIVNWVKSESNFQNAVSKKKVTHAGFFWNDKKIGSSYFNT